MNKSHSLAFYVCVMEVVDVAWETPENADVYAAWLLFTLVTGPDF